MDNYGKIISRLRKERGLTQNELGKELNVTYQAVSKWENDLSRPDFDTIAEMCKIFGITVDEFTRLASGEITEVRHTDVKAAEKEEDGEKAPQNNNQVVAESAPASAAEVADVGYASNVVAPAAPALQQNPAAPAKPAKPVHRVSVGRLIGLICAIIAGLGVFIALNCFGGWQPNIFMLFSFLCGYMIFSFIALLGHDTVVWDFLLGCLTKSIHLPGVIFTLDIDGILFLIAYKFIIAPIASVILWLACVIGGFILSFFMAGFVFPFKIPKHFKATFWGITD